MIRLGLLGLFHKPCQDLHIFFVQIQMAGSQRAGKNGNKSNTKYIIAVSQFTHLIDIDTFQGSDGNDNP